MTRLITIFSFILMVFINIPLLSQNSLKSDLEKVTLRLKYKHAFQFAGYYAAQKKGYYAQEGLKVTIKESGKKKNSTDNVLSGESQYGVWASSILNMRLSGKPLVVLAVIFQHSPFIIISRKDSKINNPADLIGKTIMTGESYQNSQFKAMLIKEGLDPHKIKKTKYTWKMQDIVNGHADASEGYLTDQPNRMRMLGVEPSIMRPITYGIDFYGDCLFTSEYEIKNHPQRTVAFRRASLKGWEYAMSHVNEMIKIIIKMKGVKERGITIKHLKYEAAQMQKLILPKLVEIGHSNPGRWKHIADTYVSLGMLKKGYSLKGLMYNPNPVKDNSTLYLFLGIILGVIVVVIISLFWTRFLNRLVKQRTQKLDAVNQLLGENEERFNYLTSNLPSVVMYQLIITPNGTRRFIYISDNVIDINQISAEAVMKDPNVLYNQILPELLPTIMKEEERCAKEMSILKYKIQSRLTDGQIRWFQLISTPHKLPNGDIAWDGVQIDITEQKLIEKEKNDLQNQLAHRSKMDAIGQLAGGVAHDFNNMLAGIIGAAQLLKLPKRNLDEKGLKYTDMIIQSVTRAADLTAKLLAFGRKGKMPFSSVNVDKVIDDAHILLNRSIDKKTETVISKNATNPIVLGDYSALQNGIINLGINASHAMSDGGTIFIRTKNIKLNESYCETSLFDLRPGEYVEIEIEDSGSGISPENIKKIFEPFFTTKEQGKGTGLGLSTVYGTVRDHHGAVTVYSEINKGTIFHIFIPCSQENVSAIQTNTKILTGSGTILLVDDEEIIRVAGEQMLQEMGYEVMLAENGLEAVEIFKEHSSNINLTIMDMIMPKMSGHNAFIEMKKIDAHCQVIIASGFTKDENLEELQDTGLAGFIDKPFRDYELSQLISRILQKK